MTPRNRFKFGRRSRIEVKMNNNDSLLSQLSVIGLRGFMILYISIAERRGEKSREKGKDNDQRQIAKERRRRRTGESKCLRFNWKKDY